MAVWWVLFQKEFRLTRLFWIVNLLVLLTIGIGGIYLANSSHSGIASLSLFVLIIWHHFYLLAYLLFNLYEEEIHGSLWLQSPQSGWILLSAKFFAGVILMFLSLLLTFTFFWTTLHFDFSTTNNNSFLAVTTQLFKQHAIELFIFIPFRSLLLASLGFLFYFIGNLLRDKLKAWRWTFILVLFVSCLLLIRLLHGISTANPIFHFGSINLLDVTKIISTELAPNSPFLHLFQNIFGQPLYWSDLLYGLLLTIACFFTVGWMLDRKVEV
ncbi:hypothetical protein [Shimazuella kribbensis]|uniref:hypothetical protein n=1 Tax=Shimazuella kribbensis TaxID=139808 RepID=UPI0004149C89|nr:hypothetical protein [Shimazuella kribbensis]